MVKRVLAAAIGALALLNAVAATLSIGLNPGCIAEAAIGAVLLAYALWWKRLTRFRVAAALAAICVALVSAATVFLIIYGSVPTATYDEDAAIVLGAGLNGEQVSKTLARRLDKAVEFATRNVDAFIIVSGGQGSDEETSEAEAMYYYLVEQGILLTENRWSKLGISRVIEESQSTTTLDNILMSAQLASYFLNQDAEEGTPFPTLKLAIITSDYHVFRAEMIARALGIEHVTHLGSRSKLHLLIPYTLRELLAVAKDAVLVLSGNNHI